MWILQVHSLTILLSIVLLSGTDQGSEVVHFLTYTATEMAWFDRPHRINKDVDVRYDMIGLSYQFRRYYLVLKLERESCSIVAMING